MGIGKDFAEVIVREHMHSPLVGDVVLIGRQTVYLAQEDALAMLAEHKLPAPSGPLELDTTTLNRLPSHAGVATISDRGFLSLLGVENAKALDHTSYEGAEIVHDLTKPLPNHLVGIADVVIDGSTLDNCFDPALTLRNYAGMLRPGGRLLAANAWSNHRDPYIYPSPLWYLDYFVCNRFADCKTYILAYVNDTDLGAYCIDPVWLYENGRLVRNFTSPWEMSCIVVAEKAADSTVDRSPTQNHYRSPEGWSEYRETLARFAKCARPHLVRSRGIIPDFEVPGGHLVIDHWHQSMDINAERNRTAAELDRLEGALFWKPGRKGRNWRRVISTAVRWPLQVAGFDLVRVKRPELEPSASAGDQRMRKPLPSLPGDKGGLVVPERGRATH